MIEYVEEISPGIFQSVKGYAWISKWPHCFSVCAHGLKEPIAVCDTLEDAVVVLKDVEHSGTLSGARAKGSA